MTETQAPIKEKEITKLVPQVEKLVGVALRRPVFRDQAAQATMHAFCKGIGNRNPLFLDPNQGRASVWGSLIAHPLYLYGVDDTYIAPGFPGYHAIYGEVDWQFLGPVRAGTAIESQSVLESVEIVETAFAGSSARQRGVTTFSDEDARVLAVARTTMLRTDRDKARDNGLYASLGKHHYSPEELDAVARAYDEEEVRGDKPRYWEDVEPGDQVIPVVKGPLTSEDMLHFVRSVRATRVFADAVQHMRQHPQAYFIDEVIGMPDSWEEAWFKDRVAQAFGFPAAHETGLQRVAWMGDALTNWCSDHGFLTALRMRLTRPCIYADSTWSKALVSSKRIDGERYIVELDVWSENQRGERTAEGVAQVLLPSRDPESLPVPLQLRGEVGR